MTITEGDRQAIIHAYHNGESSTVIGARYGVDPTTVRSIAGKRHDPASRVVYPIADARDTAWMASGACNQSDPETWFPEKGGNPKSAKRVCARCPVLDQCLTWALAHHDEGVWGGTTAHERAKLRKTTAA